jgi:hypothetical protein
MTRVAPRRKGRVGNAPVLLSFHVDFAISSLCCRLGTRHSRGSWFMD